MRGRIMRLALVFVAVFTAGQLILQLALARIRATTPVQFGGAFGFNYSPSDIVIYTGDAVQWQGDGIDTFSGHPLVSEESLWATVGSGATFSHTFLLPGAYRYYCNFHGGPGGIGMSGRVVVVSARAYVPVVLQDT